MNVERTVGHRNLGGWSFSETSGELRRRTEVRRLEPRAAKALQLLLDANGEVVSQERLIAEVWGGRSLSDNSVAVVIGQLRKALDDDAREPKLIETIPKRGYRLRSEPAAPPPTSRRKLVLAIGAALTILVAVIGFALWTARPETLAISVGEVVNETGDAAYAPLARATSELIVNDLGRRGYAVRRGGQGDLTLASKLVMWDGMPFLSINATDPSGVVRWSLMAKATPGKVPPAIDKAFGDLARNFPAKGGVERLAKPAGDR